MDSPPLPFLCEEGEGRTLTASDPQQMVFAQGDPARALFYIHAGRVKLTVVSKSGKEAVVALLGPRDFFGEGCLAGQLTRVFTATTLTSASIMRIEKGNALESLRHDPAFTEALLAYTMTRTTRVEEDLVDHLFNSSEKRLARTLLLLANEGTVGPKISQEFLAEMVGTTRSRVSFFMNKFRRLGFIQYRDTIEVNNGLRNYVMGD